ncbi:hypothetical protein ACFFRR_002777 [Megaselia abdita]
MVMENKNNSWLVTPPPLTTDNNEDDDQSDGISIISESDRDESREINSQYFWDNTHISLSNENSEREQDVPDDAKNNAKPEKDSKEIPKISPCDKKRHFLKPFLLISSLILISNLIIYHILDSQHSATFEKYQLTEAQNKDLRLEINTLRKIVFLMNVDEQVSTRTTTSKDDFENLKSTSEDVKIFDSNEKKFICVDVKRFVDIL